MNNSDNILTEIKLKDTDFRHVTNDWSDYLVALVKESLEDGLIIEDQVVQTRMDRVRTVNPFP